MWNAPELPQLSPVGKLQTKNLSRNTRLRKLSGSYFGDMMLASRPARPLCATCRTQLNVLFSGGLSPRPRSTPALNRRSRPASFPATRAFHATRSYQNDTIQSNDAPALDLMSSPAKSPADIEVFVRHTRRTFGDTLPRDLLTPEEYNIYERLFGAPIGETAEEDIALLQDSLLEDPEDDANALEAPASTLLRETPQGELAEVTEGDLVDTSDDIGFDFDSQSTHGVASELQPDNGLNRRGQRMRELQQKKNQEDEAALEEKVKGMANEEFDEDQEPSIVEEDVERLKAQQYLDAVEMVADENSKMRSHPLSLEGRFETNPSTIFIPRETFVDPVVSILSNVSNKHLADFTFKTFGGPLLPNSVATPSTKAHLRQQPIAIEATQGTMRGMEVNSFIAGNLPGTYATVMSALVETRRRLGSDWLQSLLTQQGGAHILDFGGAGAGVLAWRDVLRAEWETMHPGSLEPVPLGQATVVTGSYDLRSKISQLLDNTTFLPRLPDFTPSEDLPGARNYDPDARKHYDIIVGPHTLWNLKEDYMRKAQIQNLWSLLNPVGGVLVVIEKGVPRGFELVAGARETLLKNHISSPGSENYENDIINSPTSERYTQKEAGMIIAPCTNHGTCPMYTMPGTMTGRKDHCHFQQRFIRPAFLQRILGPSGRNYEDIRFSYLSVQRGKDMRQTANIPQNEAATLAALEGFEDSDEEPHMLSLPRVIVPPLKRHKHVTFDLCTPSAQLERWTMPLSKSKLGYRDARKARWGDLWALGAKTRVVREGKNGNLKNDKIPKKRVIEIGVGDNEDGDTIREKSGSAKERKKKDGRKGRAWSKSKAIKEEDFL